MADLLPPNATSLERNIAQANARLGEVPVEIPQLYQPATCPANWLPWLADNLSVDAWESSWNESQKRASIASSIKVHRLKGTISAMREALGAIGLQIEVQEWFQLMPRGTPFTFRLVITADQVGYDKATLDKIENVVNDAKNLRSHLAEIVPRVSTVAATRRAVVTSSGIEMQVQFDAAGFPLMLEGVANGLDETELAVDDLHHQVHVKLPKLLEQQ